MPAVSKKQRNFFGLVLAYKRGEVKDVSADVKKAADSMTLKDIEKYASTKHKGLPMKKEQLIEQGLYELFGLFGKKPQEPPYQTSSPARLGTAKVYTGAEQARALANLAASRQGVEGASFSPSDVSALIQAGLNRFKFSTPAQVIRNVQGTALNPPK